MGEKYVLLCCCAFFCLLPLPLSLTAQAARQTNGGSIDLTYFGRRPEASIHERDLFRERGWWSKKLAAVSKGDKSIKEASMAARSRGVSSALATRARKPNEGRGSRGNHPEMTALAFNNEALASKSSERSKSTIEAHPARGDTRAVSFSFPSLNEEESIDPEETPKTVGERTRKGEGQAGFSAPAIKRQRRDNAQPSSAQTNPTFSRHPHAIHLHPNTGRKSTPAHRALSSGPPALPITPSIFPSVETWQGSSALRGSVHDRQSLQRKVEEEVNGVGEGDPLTLLESSLNKSAATRVERLKSEASRNPASPVSGSRSALFPTFHPSRTRQNPDTPSEKGGQPRDSGMIPAGESITNSAGVPGVTSAESKRGSASKDGQWEVKVTGHSSLLNGQSRSLIPPPSPSPANIFLSQSVNVIDFSVESGTRRGADRRGRVRRDIQNDGDGEGGGANITADMNGVGLNGSVAGMSDTVDASNATDGDQNHTSSAENVHVMSSVSSDTNSTVTASGVWSSVTTGVISGDSTLALTAANGFHQPSSSASSVSSSTPTSSTTAQVTSSNVSSNDGSSTNMLPSSSSGSSIIPPAQTMETSSTGSRSVITATTTKASVAQTVSVSTQPVPSDVTSSGANDSQPITKADGMTSPHSKFGSSSTAGVNEVSPTRTSRRTARSTQTSSSSTPTSPPPTPSADSAVTTPTTTTTTSTSSDLPAGSTPSAEPASSTSPTDPTSGASSPSSDLAPSSEPSSTELTPKDVFGDLWTADPEPVPEGGSSFPEPVDGAGDNNETMEGEEEPVSEPGPDWDNAKMVWQGAWEVHLYVFACLFACLGVYTLVSVLRLWRIHRLLSRRYFVSLNLLMLLLCLSRAVYLSVDGYNSKGTFHPSVDYFFYSISFPCLTSAFSIQLYALLQATKMQFLPPTIQKMSLLVTMVVFHFVISLVTDVIVGMYAGMQIMLFVCQLFYILWGLFLFFGYAYIFRRLYLHAVKRQKNVMVHHQHQLNGSGGGGGAGSAYNVSSSSAGGLVKPKSKFTLSVAVKVTFSTAILGLVTLGLEVYGVVGVYKNFSDERPQPWPWYVYHTVLRLVEFLMCATMSYVASQPFRYRQGRQTCCCPVLCAPCAEIFCCGADVNRSDVQAAWSELDQHQLRASLDRGPPHHLSPDLDRYPGNGLGHRGSKSSQRGGGGDLTVTAKARIYFSDQDDVRPIVTSQPGSRPTSATSETLENRTLSTRGSASGEGSLGPASPEKKPPSSLAPVTTSTPVKTWNGVVNTAYMPTVDDPQPQPPEFKSRKSSIASSEYFLAPSVSLADSLASELDKAFRSMHEGDPRQASMSSVSGHSQDVLDKSQHEVDPKAFPSSSIQRFLQHPNAALNVNALRRSRSAFGRSSFYDTDDVQQKGEKEEAQEAGGKGAMLAPGGAWHQKLFRSRSDNLSGVRTKDVANATYMSLLDIEQQNLQQETSTVPKHADSADATLTADSPADGPSGVQTATLSQTDACTDHGTREATSGKSRNDGNNRETSEPHASVPCHVKNSEGDDKSQSSRSPSHLGCDVKGVATSTGVRYRTVISVGEGGSVRDSEGVGERGSHLGSPSLSTSPSLSSPTPFKPPPFSGSPSLFRSGLASSPHGLMSYGNAPEDEEEDIEV